MSADTSDLIGDSIEATVTVTLAAPKLPLVLPPAEMKAGEVVIADIGIPADVIDQLEGPSIELLTRELMRPLIQPRAPDAHKGDFGRVLVVAGSMGKAGAAVLCAQGAMRAGAGLVTVAAPKSCQPTIAAHAADYMTEGLDETNEGTVHFSAADAVLGIDADVIVAGPGLGRGEAVTTFVRELLDKCEGPLVLDADALNAFADEPALLVGREGRDLIITPHPGEMARLVGCTVEDLQADRIGIATDFAKRHKLYVVLKGYRTLVVTPDEKVFVNPDRLPRHGDRRHRRCARRHARRVARAAARCRSRVQGRCLSAWIRRRARRCRQRRGLDDRVDLVDHIGDAILEVTARRRVATSKAE